MPLYNSAWGRLADAWQPESHVIRVGIGPAGVPLRTAEDAVRMPTAERRVLVVSGGGGVAVPLSWHGCFASPGDDDAAHYRVEVMALASPGGLDRLLRERSPRVLIADAAVCVQLGEPALRHLRRLHSQTEWVIAWHEPSPRCLPVLIQTQARGCIEWAAGPSQLARALDAVATGDLWFPREVSRWLYTSLLGTMNGSNEAAATAPVTESNSEPCCDLSQREAQAMALMRQGLTNKQIGDRLDISVNTVKKHLTSVFEKRGIHSRRQTLE